MKYETMCARTYVFMYELSKSDYYLREALKSDKDYTTMVAIEKGFYWKIERDTVCNKRKLYPKLKAV